MAEYDVPRMSEEAGVPFSGRQFGVQRSVTSCCHDPSGHHDLVEEHNCCHVHAGDLPANSHTDELGEDHYENILGWTVQNQGQAKE